MHSKYYQLSNNGFGHRYKAIAYHNTQRNTRRTGIVDGDRVKMKVDGKKIVIEKANGRNMERLH